ncbi:nuclear transport factor 2 family protein [Alkalimarinus sediminis]|uniref:Nuclear transport factor 2 family protein n=1 Tax=Alkalimarinus sediminis TaxID=1632866 RepID=A0A9E8KQ29_9ALTE|nr:nuclear transport factor 2 family protein [Alkalimarinus sediminis]UZW75953.1 nuclear transport factor 2 family protein [Alkalimarinus sediminis]
MTNSVKDRSSSSLNRVSELDSALELVEQFKWLYKSLNANNCNSGIVDAVYTQDMLFQDSFHRIEGVDELKEYFSALYLNLKSSEFTFHNHWIGNGSAMLTWTMTYSHPRLNGGREISMEGATEIRFGEKVYYHKDYFDGGSLLYEHVPVLGTVIKQLKKYMAK